MAQIPPSTPAGGGDTRRSNEPLSAPLTELRGVGPVMAKKLARLDLQTVGDLLHHIPVRYEDLELREDLRSIPDGFRKSLFGTVTEDPAWIPSGQGRWETTLICDDPSATPVTLQWFMPRRFQPPVRGGFSGWVTGAIRIFRRPTIAHPTVCAAADRDPPPPGHGGIVAVYRSTAGVTQDFLRKLMDQILDRDLQLEDSLPEILTGGRSIDRLYRGLHQPESSAELEVCHQQLARLELYFHAEGQARTRRRRQQVRIDPLPLTKKIRDRIEARFPFDFTGAQNRVIGEIDQDLQAGFPMARLVQGDVGSGKTAVALWAILAAVAHGKQAALVAPTMTLAEQHLRTLEKLLSGSRLKISLVVSGTSSDVKEEISRGEVDIVVGTHAVMSDSVQFQRLALVVVDEEQKFGVGQRQKLAAKGASVHRLHLSATPIPRSLALALRGEFDLSRVDEKPPGRQPVKTRRVPSDRFPAAIDFLCREIDDGQRALFVVPRIEDGDGDDPQGVEQVAKRLLETTLASRGITLLHGRLSPEERSRNMEKFRQGSSAVLVATSIVEVGLDIPELSVLWIENADRFGLSQLHQLRGRVGRGDRASWCFFTVSGDPEETEERLQAFIDEDDGFRIAERDLELRGGGEVHGVRQSGQGRFLLARPLADLDAFRRLSEVAGLRLDRGEDSREQPLLKRLSPYLGPDRPSHENTEGTPDGPLAAP
ncbi:MAG: ATP-dependent DNA helicase RecG [Planctomycetes bacterium]|nr:ATP-dependent DNA helicase RecG [Planctomycetota bacterium]